MMHHKEFYSAGNTGKLLLAMLPPSRAQLFVYGKSGDWEVFTAELAIDPRRTIALWPGVGAITIDDFLRTTAAAEEADEEGGEAVVEEVVEDEKRRASDMSPPPCQLLRVIVLDGSYSQASAMWKAMRKRLQVLPRAVALHPKTLSVFHRARKG